MLKPLPVIVDLSITPLNSVNICFAYFKLCYQIFTDLWLLCVPGELTLLSQIIFIILKSILSCIHLAIPAF